MAGERAGVAGPGPGHVCGGVERRLEASPPPWSGEVSPLVHGDPRKKKSPARLLSPVKIHWRFLLNAHEKTTRISSVLR